MEQGIFSFEINKTNPLPTLTAPCPLIFLLNLSNTEDVALVANIGKASLAKRTDNQTFNRKFT